MTEKDTAKETTKEPSKGDSPQSESMSYKLMLEDVETICREVASPDLDLDAMVKKIEQGYGLIKVMRARLEETKGKVEQLRVAFE